MTPTDALKQITVKKSHSEFIDNEQFRTNFWDQSQDVTIEQHRSVSVWEIRGSIIECGRVSIPILWSLTKLYKKLENSTLKAFIKWSYSDISKKWLI